MRLHQRSVLPFALVLAATAAVAFSIWRYVSAPPLIARLLPEADAIVYANLKPARLATHFDRSAPPRSPGFQSFVEATGIVPERDLDEAAFALQPRENPDGPDGPVAYSEIFRGSFDAARLERYLGQTASRREQYAGQTIYALPTSETGAAQPRLLRVTILDPGRLIAASNAPTAEQMHAMIDHQRAGYFGLNPPTLLARHYREVPTAASAWGLGRLGLPLGQSGRISLLGFELPLPADQPFIASLRYVGVLRLRIETLSGRPELALQQAGALSSLLNLARSLAAAPSNPSQSADLEHVLRSVEVVQENDRVVITASLPGSVLQQFAPTGSTGQ